MARARSPEREPTKLIADGPRATRNRPCPIACTSLADEVSVVPDRAGSKHLPLILFCRLPVMGIMLWTDAAALLAGGGWCVR